MDQRIDEVLPLVTKPIRYTGGEYNALSCDPENSRVSWVLGMPEVYEIGMSNYGLRVLYSIINRIEGASCDRVFVPWPDLGGIMQARHLPLYALESKRPVSEFDILGVSLQSELSCTNLLYLLDLAHIPLRRAERDERHPLVVAGGPVTVNPMPWVDFVDVFAVGDGEALVREITAAVGEWNGRERGEILERLAMLEGVFVPGYNGKTPGSVRRAVVPELNEADFPFPPLVPICEVTHDRLTIEIARGCLRGCRFCQAGFLNRPTRFRDIDQIVRIAERGIRATGWDEVSLLSLSTLDYPNILELVQRLNGRLKERRVAISLPSTRGEDFSPELAFDLQEVKKAGLTFAPETASDRLRAVVNKHISEARILESVRNALDAGWNGVKLYFMVGLPGETEADTDEIGRFVQEVATLCRGRPVRYNLSPFVPKPHTPLQWAAFADIGETRAKIERVRARVTRRNARAKWENPECSWVQALLARGDERVGRVVEYVYQKGGIFQEWSEHFRFALWQEACAAAGLDAAGLVSEKPVGAALPWDLVDVGVSREFLEREYERSRAGTPTPDCSSAGCTGCGACPDGVLPPRPEAGPDSAVAGAYARRSRGSAALPELRTRFRLKYAVGESYRFAAHLDRVRAFYRSLRRSELPVAYTKGYAPKPMLSFGPPLPVGVTSDGEYVDVFTGYHYTGNIVRDLGAFLPRGLRVVAARSVSREAKSLGSIINLGRYEIAPPPGSPDPGELAERAGALSGVRELRFAESGLVHLDLAIEPGVKLFDALAALFGLSDAEARCLHVRRMECFAAADGRLRTPLED